jgi:hypothetical protein
LAAEVKGDIPPLFQKRRIFVIAATATETAGWGVCPVTAPERQRAVSLEPNL